MTGSIHNEIAHSQLEEVHDILEAMREKEERVYRSRCHFQLDDLEQLWRKILIEWMTFVVDHCNLQRQAVSAAAFFLDVAMGRGLVETREEHQLAAASALQLALKLFDSTVIRIEKLVSLGRGLFTVEDVGVMEYKILTALDFHCHPISTHCYLRQYERLLPDTVKESTRRMIDEVTNLVAELTVADHKYNNYSNSMIAYGAMLMAMEILDSEDLPICQRQCFILRMSTVSKLESNSSKILTVFGELKETLDSSSKLEGLVESLRKVQLECTTPVSKGNRTKSPSGSSKLQSPRDVMERVGSYSNNSSSPSRREISQ
jgi:hypothetical protein